MEPTQIGIALVVVYCLFCWFAGWAVVSSNGSSTIQPDELFGFTIIVTTPIWLPILCILAAIDVLYWTPKRKAEEARWRQPWNTVTKKSYLNKSWFRLPIVLA